ncbi:unnamed protein product [Cuscuta europaea]|uniref:Reverse transcriptase/retrotransposon-derived protein RNase H-like domain-containing protein n=1 Tax=Cuscuta europaea TaxID=41803 RepID=A0A9P1DXX9_CUSEU|nr:unnamed protein product [Cuscuta europaea]
MSFWTNYMVPKSSLNSIYDLATIRFVCIQLTLRKPHSDPSWAFSISCDGLWPLQRPIHVPSSHERGIWSLSPKICARIFDDILIYSTTWVDHVHHLKVVFHLLQTNSLYLKRSKCDFGSQRVSYLGHVIDESGVAADSSKIQAVVDWPKPISATALLGFLGLAGFYRKFIKDYCIIATPLANLLHRNAFQWNEQTDDAFNTLKTTLSSALVLQLPNFSILFVIECDASGIGICAVLH